MRGWAYQYHLQINNPNPKIEFLDGEIEEIYWLTIEEINEKIKNKEKITKISIDMFNKFIKKEDYLMNFPASGIISEAYI